MITSSLSTTRVREEESDPLFKIASMTPKSTLEPKFQLRLNLSRGNEVPLENIGLSEAYVYHKMLTLVNQL